MLLSVLSGRRRPLLAPAVVAVLVPAALAPAASAAPATVSVSGNAFSPAAVAIETGEAVTWEFRDGAHNVKGDGWSGNNGFGKGSWSRTFASAGTFAYVCEAHPDMKGTVTVTAATAVAAAPATSAPAPAAAQGLAAAALDAWAFPAAEDRDGPRLRGVHASLARRGRARLTLRLGEDSAVLVVVRRSLRARRGAERTYRLRGRRGLNRFTLPRGLRAGVSLVVVAFDEHGNESRARVARLRGGRRA